MRPKKSIPFCNCSSVISNVGGTVSIIPMNSAKTFVNGNLISTATVLHHVRTEPPTAEHTLTGLFWFYWTYWTIIRFKCFISFC